MDAVFLSDIKRIFVYDIFGCLALSLNGAGMDFLLGLGKTKITLIINFTRIFLLRILVLMILQHLIADGATALGIMMLISNGCCAILTTSICIAVSRHLLRNKTDVQQKA